MAINYKDLKSFRNFQDPDCSLALLQVSCKMYGIVSTGVKDDLVLRLKKHTQKLDANPGRRIPRHSGGRASTVSPNGIDYADLGSVTAFRNIDCTIDVLEVLCRLHHLPHCGPKDVLIQRLEQGVPREIQLALVRQQAHQASLAQQQAGKAKAAEQEKARKRMEELSKPFTDLKDTSKREAEAHRRYEYELAKVDEQYDSNMAKLAGTRDDCLKQIKQDAHQDLKDRNDARKRELATLQSEFPDLVSPSTTSIPTGPRKSFRPVNGSGSSHVGGGNNRTADTSSRHANRSGFAPPGGARGSNSQTLSRAITNPVRYPLTDRGNTHAIDSSTAAVKRKAADRGSPPLSSTASKRVKARDDAEDSMFLPEQTPRRSPAENRLAPVPRSVGKRSVSDGNEAASAPIRIDSTSVVRYNVISDPRGARSSTPSGRQSRESPSARNNEDVFASSPSPASDIGTPVPFRNKEASGAQSVVATSNSVTNLNFVSKEAAPTLSRASTVTNGPSRGSLSPKLSSEDSEMPDAQPVVGDTCAPGYASNAADVNNEAICPHLIAAAPRSTASGIVPIPNGASAAPQAGGPSGGATSFATYNVAVDPIQFSLFGNEVNLNNFVSQFGLKYTDSNAGNAASQGGFGESLVITLVITGHALPGCFKKVDIRRYPSKAPQVFVENFRLIRDGTFFQKRQFSQELFEKFNENDYDQEHLKRRFFVEKIRWDPTGFFVVFQNSQDGEAAALKKHRKHNNRRFQFRDGSSYIMQTNFLRRLPDQED